jgi:hypothetical protein
MPNRSVVHCALENSVAEVEVGPTPKGVVKVSYFIFFCFLHFLIADILVVGEKKTQTFLPSGAK